MSSESKFRRQMQVAQPEARSAMFDVLAEDAAAGDIGASADLAWAIKHFGIARPAVRQILFKDDDVDMAEQHTLVAVALRIGSYRSEARFTTWLHRVALNEAKQMVRSSGRDRARTHDESPHELADHFVARLSSMVVNRERIDAEIAALSDTHRSALLLREEQGFSYAEIAAALEVPEPTAKTWVRRARLQLAERLTL